MIALLLAALGVLVGLVPASAGEALGWEGLPLARVELVNGTRVGDAEVLRLLGLRPGVRLSPRELERGVSLLALKPEVDRVVVRGTRSAGGMALRVEVSPRLLARSVDLAGVPRGVDSRLRSLLKTRVDQPVREPVLRADEKTLAEAMIAEGYPDARVAAEVVPGGSGQWARVRFRVHPGEPTRVVRIEVPPGQPLEPRRLWALLGLGPGDPASRTRLREGVRRLVRVLWDEGYPEARVEGPRFDPEDGGAVLRLPLMVGERTDIRVEGIDAWAARPLKEELRLRLGRPIDRAWCRDAAEDLQRVLRAQGYREARVVPEITRAYGRRRVVFHVTRGLRARLEEVRFVGNRSIPARKLLKYMSLVQGGLFGPPPFTDKALARDLRVLGDYYATKGFWDARVEVAELTFSPSGRGRMTLRVQEGRRYRWGDVRFEVIGEAPGDPASVVRVRRGGRADPSAVDFGRQELLRWLGRSGYPEARVAYEMHPRPESATVDVTFRVRTGPRTRFGRTVVSGNVRTRTKVIRRELTFRKGDPWDPEAVRESRQRLYRLGFFQKVRIVPADGLNPDGTRDVEVRVEEQDAGLIEWGVGYGSEERVKGFLGISHGNLQGYGRSLGLRADYDALQWSTALNFREPWLFNHPWDLRLTLIRRQQNREAYDLQSLGFQASVEREMGRRSRGSILYTLESNRLSNVEEETELTNSDTGTYLLSSIGPVVVLDMRDDPFNPRRGTYTVFRAEWASPLLGSQARFERYVGSVSGFLSAGRFTLALLARGGIALTAAQTAQLPVNKRFFLGGRSTVRGFERDEIGPQAEDGTPIGGDVMVNLKAEGRWRFGKRFGVALFWDAGNVWNRSVEPPNYTELRQSVGFGLRYETPVGPMSLDVGFKLPRKGDESPYAWHFTVGNVF